MERPPGGCGYRKVGEEMSQKTIPIEHFVKDTLCSVCDICGRFKPVVVEGSGHVHAPHDWYTVTRYATVNSAQICPECADRVIPQCLPHIHS